MAVEKLKVKAAWQLYAGVNDVSPSDANQISKYIDEYEDKLKHADEDEKDDIHVEDFIPIEYLDIFLRSNEYRGITINLKVHACGTLIYDGDIRREIGLISATSKTTGKRTLCACIEGKILDDFGLVKEDFLIVDSVSLTEECFRAIGKPVPSFDELRQMVNNDKETWDIYSNGITCCVNQCEKLATIQKVMKYKPQNIAELSAFIAAIRPGFAPLLQTFLNREPYTTGEEKIDQILEDSYHFMIYQESIMKVLGYLDIPIADTYKIIKNISKKKYRDHPEELKQLKERLIVAWEKKIGNRDNFDNVWDVIESSAAYSFNAPHAYSMAGDSLYQAWFKAHYTVVFYETAIKHYQKKNKKDKIDALIKEMIQFYGYRLGDYKFGNDNRVVSIDQNTKTIYPNMSSIKSFGERTSLELFELSRSRQFNDFIDVLNGLSETTINKTILDKLIRINYFSDYGDVNKLLREVTLYNLLYNKKEISKEKAQDNDIPEYLLQKYGHETTKKYNKLDCNSILRDMINDIPFVPISKEEQLKNEFDVFGMITTVFPEYDKTKYFVLGIDHKKTLCNVELYEIFSGKTRKVKIWARQYNCNEFKAGDIIMIILLQKKNQREPSGEINPITGKKIYRDVPDKYDYWLQSYEVLRDE